MEIRPFRDRLASGGYGPEMVRIPAGTFRMGCNQTQVDSGHCHERYLSRSYDVTIATDFAMAVHETTFEAFDRFVEATGYRIGNEAQDVWGRGRQPATQVSYRSAEAYAAWLSEETGHAYRLPSESEWEYAARRRHGNRLELGQRDRQRAGQLLRLRQPLGRRKPGARRFVRAESLGAARHARQCLRNDPGTAFKAAAATATTGTPSMALHFSSPGGIGSGAAWSAMTGGAGIGSHAAEATSLRGYTPDHQQDSSMTCANF